MKGSEMVELRTMPFAPWKVAVSPLTSAVVVCGMNGMLALLDATLHNVLWSVSVGKREPIRGAAFSSDGASILAVNTTENCLDVYDAATGGFLRSIKDLNNPQDVAVDAAGNVIVAVGCRRCLHVLTPQLTQVAEVKLQTRSVTAVAIHPRGCLALVTHTGVVVVTPVTTGEGGPGAKRARR
eukprot:TRINITY_DN15949_c0_g1_i2.p1 TRINITY_DN15949_c0_g1~~TRINITY_DN15949_c0_g1_i2.p1  ORF type:complete len:182 (+),score=21.81 TRINITY_DN15949_c0_g1_i2:478-1023(+)